MYACFCAQDAVGAGGSDFEDGFLQGRVAGGVGHAVRSFVFQECCGQVEARAQGGVHAQEVCCEESCFAAANARSDLYQAGQCGKRVYWYQRRAQGGRSGRKIRGSGSEVFGRERAEFIVCGGVAEEGVEFSEGVCGFVVGLEGGGYGCEFADALCGSVIIIRCDGSCEPSVLSGSGAGASEEGGGDWGVCG